MLKVKFWSGVRHLEFLLLSGRTVFPCITLIEFTKYLSNNVLIAILFAVYVKNVGGGNHPPPPLLSMQMRKIGWGIRRVKARFLTFSIIYFRKKLS